MLFILWKRVDGCNIIHLICDDIPTFKHQYLTHRHLTTNSDVYRWTRENINVDVDQHTYELQSSTPLNINMSTKIHGNIRVDNESKVHLNKNVVLKQSGLQQNVAGTSSLTGFFFDGFGPGKTLNDVEIGWFANGGGVVNAVVTNINTSTQKITIAVGHGLFQSGVSYTFFNTPQYSH